jgi:Rieske Fe-S protein
MSALEGKPITRRDFMRSAAAGIAAVIGAVMGLPSLAYLLSPSLRADDGQDAELPLGPLGEFPIGVPTRREFTRTQVNGWERTATNHGMYVVRLDESHVRAFSDICTHLACRVSWRPELGHYVSPCHDGHFDILGGNVSGPPPRPLDEFITRVEQGTLFVRLPPYRRA